MAHMQTKLTLTPGQRGTKKLLQQYGDQLVCIRYRYNSELKKRFKTVELIIEESPWQSENGKGTSKKVSKYDRPVFLRVGIREFELREQIKSAGGRWDNIEKLWVLPYRKAVEFGLVSRIFE